MILVDTAVWLDYLRDDDSHLAGLLERGGALAHPWVTGELALGNLRGRAEILRLLDHLPQASVATAAEMRRLVEQHELFAIGIGYVDAQLLAATMLTVDAELWTRDRQLQRQRSASAWPTHPRHLCDPQLALVPPSSRANPACMAMANGYRLRRERAREHGRRGAPVTSPSVSPSKE